MSYFKAKMHQIRFPLGLCPRHRWESLQRSPDPLAVFRGLLLRGGAGRGRGEKKVKGKGEEKGKGRGRGREGEGKGRGGKERWGNGFAGPMSNCFLRACLTPSLNLLKVIVPVRCF